MATIRLKMSRFAGTAVFHGASEKTAYWQIGRWPKTIVLYQIRGLHRSLAISKACWARSRRVFGQGDHTHETGALCPRLHARAAGTRAPAGCHGGVRAATARDHCPDGRGMT